MTFKDETGCLQEPNYKIADYDHDNDKHVSLFQLCRW
jgi:hypothetical protein